MDRPSAVGRRQGGNRRNQTTGDAMLCRSRPCAQKRHVGAGTCVRDGRRDDRCAIPLLDAGGGIGTAAIATARPIRRMGEGGDPDGDGRGTSQTSGRLKPTLPSCMPSMTSARCDMTRCTQRIWRFGFATITGLPVESSFRRTGITRQHAANSTGCWRARKIHARRKPDRALEREERHQRRPERQRDAVQADITGRIDGISALCMGIGSLRFERADGGVGIDFF